jgi:hypothetical protein
MVAKRKEQNGDYRCPEDNCAWVPKSETHGAQELGRHLKFVHGINGKSASAQKAQSVKAESTTALAVVQPKRTYTKRSSLPQEITNGEAAALITVGYIKAICETEAKKLEISQESFTRRCAELFFASQVR